MTGFIILLGGRPISWSINDTVHQLHYIRKLFKPLRINSTRAITLYNNNQSTIKIVTDLTGKTYRGALKHTDIKIKHLCKQVAQKTVIVKYCSTKEMPADLLTKGLTKAKLKGLLPRIGLRNLSSGE
jgi:hypothetical protein